MSDRTIVHDNTMLFRGKEACPTYLVLLDQPLDGRIVKSLWDLAMMRVCVDGGANYLLQACPDLVPDAIVGDMKGITERTRREYEGRDVTIVEDKSTECSDLDKALTWLRDHVDNTGEAQVMLYMGEGGRFDRIMCGINDLFLGYDFKRLVLLSRETMMFLLPTGRSQIKRFTKVEQKYCGMLPVGAPVRRVSVKGLKYEVDGELKFGGRISTSNEATSDDVFIETSEPLVWYGNLDLNRLMART